MKFTVHRSKWLRGGRAPNGEERRARLVDGFGCKCCLGFLAEACGADLKVLAEYGAQTPEGASLLAWPAGIVDDERNTDATYALLGLNDAKEIVDADRERALTESFAKLGIEVEFVE